MKDGPRNAQTASTALLDPSGTNQRESPPTPHFNGGEMALSAWQQLFHRIPSEQRKNLLDEASRQGSVSLSDIPVLVNPAEQDPHPAWLTDILAGRIGDLEPVRAGPIECFDSCLDETQRRAVAEALQTPDVSLIQGLPGTGKSRVVAEIVHQATLRGERVLYVSPWENALDSVLISQAGKDFIFPWRLLWPDENPDLLSPLARSFTRQERLRQLKDQIVPDVGHEVQEVTQRLKRLRPVETVWSHLLTLARQHGELTKQIEKLSRCRLELVANVEAEFAAGGEIGLGDNRLNNQPAALRDKRSEIGRLESELKDLQSLIFEKQKDVQDLDAELTPLKPLIDARTQGRFWTWTWWQTIFGGARLAQARGLQERCQQARQVIEKLTDRDKEISGQIRELQQVFESDRRSLIEKEIGERVTEVTKTTERLTEELGAVEELWRSTCLDLPGEVSPPLDISEEAVATAQRGWQDNLGKESARETFLNRWLDHLRKEPEEIADTLFHAANLVLGKTGSIEPSVLTGPTAGAAFDLLIIEGAQKVTDAEFLRLAECCLRCVLIGESSIETPIVSLATRKQNHPQTAKASSNKPSVFQRLWSLLHCDPRQLPYQWRMEQDRLCCQLRSVKPDQRHWLESEPVADHADIELRILNMPRKAPVLAEVAFPRSVSIVQAKEYVFNEIQELAVQAAGGNVKWTEHPDRIAFSLSDRCSHEGTAVPLTAGVFELIEASRSNGGSNPWHTCCLEFHRESGWQRLQAEAWVERQLSLRDLGRTVCLETAYRMSPELGQFFSNLLFQGYYSNPIRTRGRIDIGAQDENVIGDASVEFVPVPASGGKGTVRPISSRDRPSRVHNKGGVAGALVRDSLRTAGMEVDLADFTQRSRLPAELSLNLPEKGLVNYDEALSMIHALESLASSITTSGQVFEPDDSGRPLSIGVTALYPAQVELLRRLIDQIPRLAASPISVVVDVPEGFREREFTVVLLGVTRSHGYRATSLGGDPQALVLALTRARKNLFLFGDLDTLIRRSQWDGPVENLDEQASALERGIVARIVRHIQEQETNPSSFRVRLGGWT
ncbi:MAG: AAA domain-containing protein [Gemmataceae bacterium]